MAREKNREIHFMSCSKRDLQLMAHQILHNFAEEIRGSFCELICDEYADISNKEQLTLCLRWIDECFSVYEGFLDFYEVLNINSGTIVSAIRDVLLISSEISTQIYLEKCKRKCYDGARDMVGKKSGVANSWYSAKGICYSLSLSFFESCCKRNDKRIKTSVR